MDPGAVDEKHGNREPDEPADADRAEKHRMPASPERNTSMAKATTMTLMAPRTKVWAAPSSVTRRAGRLPVSSRPPAT